MLKNYLKISLRALHKQKGYTFINVAGLTVGMACCLMILLFIQDEYSYDRFHEQADQIYRIALDGHTSNGAIQTAQTAPTWGPMLADQYPEVLTAVRLRPPNQKWLVNYEDRRFFEKGFVFADSTAFDAFTFPLIQGDPQTALDAPFSVVLTTSMAQKYFGTSDPMGKMLRLDNTYDFTVTGLMEDISGPSHIEITFLASLSSLRTPIYGDNYLNENIRPVIYNYLLLQPGTDIAQFNAKLSAFVEQTIGPQLESVGVEMRPFLQPLTDIHLRSNLENETQPNGDLSTIYTFGAIALFILLIACINFMNLSTARSASRAREVGLRKVLGAERPQLIRQFLGEAMLLSGIAAVLSLGVLWLALPYFNNLTGKSLAFASTMQPLFVLGLVALAALVGLFAGSYPAFFLSAFQPVTVLKGKLQHGSRGVLLRRGLVVFQFAISIFLITGTVVVHDQLTFMRNKNLGFEKDQVVVMQLTDPQIRTQYQAFRDRVEQLPQIQNVSAASSTPGTLINTALVMPEGVSQEESTMLDAFFVDYDFFETLNMEMVAGRTFSEDFATDADEGIIINEATVSLFGWNSPADAIGKTIQFVGNRTNRVVGVVKDFHSKSPRQNIEPTIITLQNEQAFFYMVARVGAGDLSSTLSALEAAWQEFYPAYVFEYSFLDEDFDRLYKAESQLGNVFSGFSILTIFIACLGLFGLASFTAEQRTKEIGVRKVLGASIFSILLLLTKEFGTFVGLAFVLAAPLAYFAMNRWLDTFAFRTTMGPETFIIVGLAAFIIAALTVSYQSLKAALGNPVNALRYE